MAAFTTSRLPHHHHRHHLLLILLLSIEIRVIFSATDPGDVTVLRSLMDQWKNTLPSWQTSSDPCGSQWEGVICNDTRVTALELSTMGLKGGLGGDIGGLSELRSLDLSFNRDLIGSVSPQLGQLSKLNILILAGCGFSGSIPGELGKLSQLSFLALNSNNFTGGIPPSLGNLTKLYWLDLGNNKLTGSIPVSNASTPGLDQLLHVKHFHFNKNQLSGTIPPQLFRPEMILIHILFDGNQLTGTIPSTIGLIQTLEVLRLDRNHLTGEVPSNLNNLTHVSELNLGHNRLTGPLPDLTGMDSLAYVDLSYNLFDESEAPEWLTTLKSLTTLVIENGPLQGPLPELLFSFPQLQQVKLKNNGFNGTLSMGDSVSQQLELVDLQHNEISSVTLGSSYKSTLILIDNPVCSSGLSETNYCQAQQQQTRKPYSTSLGNCEARTCQETDEMLSPQSCECAYPYEGTLFFRGPSFRQLSNASVFHALEMSLWVKLSLTPGSVFLQNPFFNTDDYLQMHLALFPSSKPYFNRTEVQRIGFAFSNQTYKPPPELGFGPYYFIAEPYLFQEMDEKSGLSLGLIIGISVAATLLVLVLLGVGVYAILQKKRAEKAIGLSKPFASWASSGKESIGGAPQLKGARWFSYQELKKSSGNFSSSNEIGAGGYGKVYRGVLSDGQLVAIKRAQQGSMQGGLEFKTEIELLSRVHHKNLVGLVGFCFEQGEQMLVYEFMPNGSGYLDPEYYLTQQLTEKSDVYSFGVVLFELITAKQPIEKGKYIVREVKTVLNKSDVDMYGLQAFLDPRIRGAHNILPGFTKYIELALQCVEESACERPTMGEVVKAIETILQNDGIGTNSTASASSSITDFGKTSQPARHPYQNDALPIKDASGESDGAFEYSGGYTISNSVEPK
ncbi:hypothetical protein V2J09_013323 [Rumex salicifolius]